MATTPTKNIKNLPVATSFNAGDVAHISQNGVDKQIQSTTILEQLNSGQPFRPNVLTESSTSRTLTGADKAAYISCTNSLTTTITVSSEASSNWRMGEVITIHKEAAGDVVFQGASGVTVNPSVSGLTLSEVGQVGTLLYKGNNIWDFLTGGSASTSIQGAITFADIVGLKSGSTVEGGTIIDWSGYLGRKVSTVVHNTTSNEGGAPYVIVNVNPSNLSTLVGGIWVGANHDLGGGFYAKLVYGGTIFTSNFGVDGYDQALAACNFAVAVGVKEVVFKNLPLGANVLDLSDKKLSFRGFGINTSTITATGLGGIRIINTSGGSPTHEYIGDFRMSGGYAAGSVGINLQHCRRSVLKNIFISGFETNIKELDSFVLYHEKILSVDSKYCYDLAGANHATTFVSCGATDFGDSFGGVGAAFRVRRTSVIDNLNTSISVIGGDFEFGAGDAFDIDASGTVLLDGVYTERCEGTILKLARGYVEVRGGEHIIDNDNGGKLVNVSNAAGHAEFTNKCSIGSSGVTDPYGSLVSSASVGQVNFQSTTLWDTYLTTNNGSMQANALGPVVDRPNKLLSTYGKNFLSHPYSGARSQTYTGNTIRCECTTAGNISVHQQFKRKDYGIGERFAVIIQYRSNVTLSCAWVDNAGQFNPSIFNAIGNSSGNTTFRVFASAPIPDSGKNWLEIYKTTGNWAIGEYLEIDFVHLISYSDLKRGVFSTST